LTARKSAPVSPTVVDNTLTNQNASVTSGTLLSHTAFDGDDVVSWIPIAG
jgi:hypothetical protein